MKKLFMLLVAFVMFFTPVPVMAQEEAPEDNTPSKTINLVYDDSGSMIVDRGEKTDRWCQAKYALEVISAMLGEKDTLNIYYMSSYSNGEKSTTPQISLNGSTSEKAVADNVSKIHNNVTANGKTPFNTVEVAYEGLKSATTDEKWLVVLTDGKFDKSKEEASAFYDKVVMDGQTKIALLFMGDDVDLIESSAGIYSAQAKDTKSILNELTNLCNIIFQNNSLLDKGFDAYTMKMSFNIPMSQLVLFAKGENVSIKGIENSKGKTIKPNSNVKVQYSTIPTTSKANDTYTDQSNWIYDDKLNGYVATFEDVKEGDYKVSVSGAESIEVYYKPAVSIKAYLFDGDEEVTDAESLVAGEYTIKFGFEYGKGKKVKGKNILLGDVDYSSSIKNTDLAGETTTLDNIKSGDKIKIKAGKLDIDVTATYLDYYAIHDNLAMQVYTAGKLDISVEDSPTYKLTTEGFENGKDPLVLHVRMNDDGDVKEMTSEQWNLLDTIKITTKEKKLGELKVEKGSDIGIFYVYPTLYDNDPLQTVGKDVPLHVTAKFKQDISTFKGKKDVTLKISSTISTLEKVIGFIKRHFVLVVGGVLLFFLLLGYVPGIKKYFPKNMSTRPLIDCKPVSIGAKPMKVNGRFNKDLISTLIPYKAQTGTITFAPSPNKTSCRAVAQGGGSFSISNSDRFIGKPINFGSNKAAKGKKLSMSAGQTITYKTDVYNYTCYLNRKK